MEGKIQKKARKIFLDVVKQALTTQNQDTGAMPGGHNGPYCDIETPVRNTSHWAISFIKAYQLTGEDKYKLSAKLCLDYLIKPNKNRTEYTFIHRQKKGKDQENGTIGTAWNIEALVIGYHTFNESKYLDLAIDLYKIFPFSKKLGLWSRITPEGIKHGLDLTFNHQLWFVSSALILYNACNDDNIKFQIDIFFDKINKYFKIRTNGLIIHGIKLWNTPKSIIKNLLIKGIMINRRVFKNQSMIYKEIGYHAFNMYAFSIIYQLGYHLDFFKTKKFQRALNFTFSNYYKNALENNKHNRDSTKLKIKKNLPINRYGYAYNAPGFEIPYIYATFENIVKTDFDITKIIAKQLEYSYNKTNLAFSNNTEDAISLTSRIYELSRVL